MFSYKYVVKCVLQSAALQAAAWSGAPVDRNARPGQPTSLSAAETFMFSIQFLTANTVALVGQTENQQPYCTRRTYNVPPTKPASQSHNSIEHFKNTKRMTSTCTTICTGSAANSSLLTTQRRPEDGNGNGRHERRVFQAPSHETKVRLGEGAAILSPNLLLISYAVVSPSTSPCPPPPLTTDNRYPPRSPAAG